MDEKIIIPFITLIVGLIGGYFLTFVSDRRKYLVENKKELRIAYARWYSLQRTAFHQITMLLESFASPSENLEQCIDVQDQLKEFQNTLSSLLQTIAEVSLLETKLNRLKTIKSLEGILNRTYDSLLKVLQTQKHQVLLLKELDYVVVAFEKIDIKINERNEINKDDLQELLPNLIEQKEQSKNLQTRFHTEFMDAFLRTQNLINKLIEDTKEFDDLVKDFFQSLEGEL